MSNPEIANSISADGVQTNYHDMGQGRPVLFIHERDDQVIPLSTSLTLSQWIQRSQLHVFGQCGHWPQIEHASRFVRLVTNFLDETQTGSAGKSSVNS